MASIPFFQASVPGAALAARHVCTDPARAREGSLPQARGGPSSASLKSKMANRYNCGD
jgi:hypothetical protein